MIGPSFQYPTTFYNARSASIVLPLVLGKTKIESILDVGCGIGTWMQVAISQGINDITGVDGSSTSQAQLVVDPTHYLQKDLGEPLDLGRRFDLAICLEVGEHLPGSKADVLVDSLVHHANLVLFSAAIPGQEGAGHINEQWATYWQGKFQQRGYYFSDSIRPLLWNNEEVDVWYKQNSVMVVRRGVGFENVFEETTNFCDLVHPALYLPILRQAQRMTLFEQGKGSLKLLAQYAWKTILQKLT